MERNESNQIKSITRKDYTTWVWLLWKSHEIISILFINNTLFWFRLNILLNESSGLTFWNRFGISNYNPYSLFRSTYQCHQNKNNRNYILQNWKWMLDLANPHSIISIHINHYFALSTNRNHHPPSFSPTLQYPISQTTHFFILIPFIIIQSFIDWWIIDYQTEFVWFFAFIDSISFADKE